MRGDTAVLPRRTGRTRPVSATAFIGRGIDLTGLTGPKRGQAGIGRKLQKPTIFQQHSVCEKLERAMKIDKRVRRSLCAWLRDDCLLYTTRCV